MKRLESLNHLKFPEVLGWKLRNKIFTDLAKQIRFSYDYRANKYSSDFSHFYATSDEGVHPFVAQLLRNRVILILAAISNVRSSLFQPNLEI